METICAAHCRWPSSPSPFPGIALATTCPNPDPAAVVKTMTDMFAALTVDDGAKLAAIFTPDAVEFDGGKRFTGSALWDLIKTLHAEGIRLVWTVQNTDVHFACDTAWIDYINRGSVFDSKTTTPVTWLESAVPYAGKKAAGGSGFLHSTQVPAPQPTK